MSKVTIRVRFGPQDSSFGEDLVDGSQVLQLFSTVATELLIREDGDEGFFRAYETVEFLDPVYSGDYVEASGEIIQKGDTSRGITFTAYKVIAGSRDPRFPSAAEVLKKPLLVARATGTCVVPKDRQRYNDDDVA